MDPTVTPSGERPGHRRRGVLAVAGVAAGVLVLGTAGAVALSRVGGDASAVGATPSADGLASPDGGLTPAAAEPADATSTDTPPPLPPAQPTLVLGDSLGLVVYPWLADLLPDRYVSYEAVVGRSTPATESRLDRIGVIPPVVIVSSGTNDPIANVFEESARRILDRLGPTRCVVWVDVVRPDRVGDSQTMMNAALDRAASGRPNVRVLRWTDLVASHPEWMAGDGIHPNETGAQARAQAFADAAQGCSALDPNAPRAKREYLPQSAFWGPVSGGYRSPSGGSSGSTALTSSAGPSSAGPVSATPTRTPSAGPSVTVSSSSAPAPSATISASTTAPPASSPATPPPVADPSPANTSTATGQTTSGTGATPESSSGSSTG